MTHYDYIVIGAGSAGCVIANRLTEDSDITVYFSKQVTPIPNQKFTFRRNISVYWALK